MNMAALYVHVDGMVYWYCDGCRSKVFPIWEGHRKGKLVTLVIGPVVFRFLGRQVPISRYWKEYNGEVTIAYCGAQCSSDMNPPKKIGNHNE